MGAKEDKKTASRLEKLKQREPGRVKLSLQQPADDLDKHPVAALISAAKAQEAARLELAAPPVAEPTEGAIDVVSATPLTTPLDTPLTTPLDTPLTTPLKRTPSVEGGGNATTAIAYHESKSRQPAPEQESREVNVVEEARARTTSATKFEYLDATHTGAEQRVYSVMYRRTVSAGSRERHFGMKELLEQTGIKAQQTIRTAIDGLIAKKSVEITEYKNGSPFGPRYRVYEPREITKRRESAGIVIDQITKKIRDGERRSTRESDSSMPFASDFTSDPSNNPTNDPSRHPSNDPSSDPSNDGSNDPSKIWRGTPLKFRGVTPLNFRGVYINKENSSDELDDPVSSSSKSNPSEEKIDADDDEKLVADYLNLICEVYERATGNTFTSADARTALAGRDIPAEVWGTAICFCVDRAPGHRFNHLAYAAEEARNHREEMRDFTTADLRAIMWRSLESIERARASGSWDKSESGE